MSPGTITVGRNQVAGWLGLPVLLDTPPIAVSGVAALEHATQATVVFAATIPALEAALHSPAGLILAKQGLPLLAEDHRVLFTADPRLAFSIVARHLRPVPGAVVHPTAVIDPGASVAATVSIGPGCFVGPGVTIGADSSLAAHVVVEAGVTVGARVVVQSGAVLGAFGFGYARHPDGRYLLFPQQGTLTIADDVEIGANTTIDRGALGETSIGSGTKIDNLVHIGHNCRIGRNVILAAQTGISGSTVVEDGAILGGQVGIGEHAHVGPDVILGGGAGVLSNKKLHGPGQVFWGRPAQPLRQYLRDLARLRKGAER